MITSIRSATLIRVDVTCSGPGRRFPSLLICQNGIVLFRSCESVKKNW